MATDSLTRFIELSLAENISSSRSDEHGESAARGIRSIVQAKLAESAKDSIFEISYRRLLKLSTPFSWEIYYMLASEEPQFEPNLGVDDPIHKYFKEALAYICTLNASSVHQPSGSRSETPVSFSAGNPQTAATNDAPGISIHGNISLFIAAFDELVHLYAEVVVDDQVDGDTNVNLSLLFAEFLVNRLNQGFGDHHNAILKIFLLAIIGNLDEILAEISRLITTIYSLLPSTVTMMPIIPSIRSNIVECVSCLTQLQQLIFLQRHVILSGQFDDIQPLMLTKSESHLHSSPTQVNGQRRSLNIGTSSKVMIYNSLQLAFNCEDEASTAAFDLVIAITIRLGFTVIAGTIHNYDQVAALLKCPLRIENPSLQASHFSSSSLASNLSSPSRTKSIANTTDSGFEYYHDITRQEAIQILVEQPPGRFLLRPHETFTNQLYLSFRNNDQENDQASKGTTTDESNSIRHAIIRIGDQQSNDSLSNDISKTYRCGRVGPCNTLNELLQQVDKQVETGLIFRPFTPDELPEELRTNQGISETFTSQLNLEDTPVKHRHIISAHALALRDPNYDFWLLTNRKLKISADILMIMSSNDGSSRLYNRAYFEKTQHLYSQIDGMDKSTDNADLTAATRMKVIHASLFVLGLKALQKQLVSSLTPESLSLSPRKTLPSSDCSRVPAFLSSIQAVIVHEWNIKKNLPFTAPAVNLLELATLAEHNESTFLQRVVEVLLSTLTTVIVESDSCIHGKVLPHHLSMPTETSSDIQEDIFQSPTALCEYLAMHIFRNIPTKNVRIPAMLGPGGFFSPNSSSSSITPTTSLTPFQDSSLVIPDRTSLSRANTENASSTYEYSIEGIEPVDILSWLTGDGKFCLKLAMRYGIFDKLLASLAISSSGASSEQSVDRDSSIRQLPSNSSDLNALAKHLVSFLVQYRVIVPVIRPADGSFSAPTNYYKYRDTWEVKLSLDSALIQTTTATKSKLGRQYYSSISSTTMTEGTAHPLPQDSLTLLSSPSLLSTVPDAVQQREMGNKEDISMLRKLWNALKGDWYLVHAIGTAYPFSQRIPSALANRSQQFAPTSSTTLYSQSITRHLYRNALLARLQLPYRFIAQIQVDILGLKEIKGRPDHFSFVHSSAQSIDAYSIIGLSRRSTTRPTLVRSPSSTNLAGISPGLESIATHSVVTASKRADSVKTANMFQSNNQATEYEYRDNFLFKFPYPEERISALLAGSTALAIPIEETLFPLLTSYPQVVGLAIFEKTFFSEKKLGELEFPLDDVDEDHGFRDWIPLSTEKASTWLVQLQVQLKFSLMLIENSPPTKEIGSGFSKKHSQAIRGSEGDEVAVASDTFIRTGTEGVDAMNPAKWMLSAVGNDRLRQQQFASTTAKGLFTQTEDIF